MRAPAPAVVIAVLSLALASTSVAIAKKAPKSNKAKAIAAVRQEIARRYVSLDTTSKLLNVSHARATILCQTLTKTRFTCDWTATNAFHEHAFGSARVIVYPGGGQATLYNVRCTNSAVPTLPCF
jgi:uncharacterized SAM-dependent methyltransferase